MKNPNQWICKYCYTKNWYTSDQPLARCEACGEYTPVTEFLAEKIRLEAVQEEAEKTKEDLYQAQKTKREAEQRLFQLLTQLEDISISQEEQEKNTCHSGWTKG